MYFDKDMYRIYWKMVHNRAGEYFYTAMCGYHFVKNDETFSAVFPNLVVGVNDKTNRAALGGRLPELVHRAELGPELLLAPHAHPHDRLSARGARAASSPLARRLAPARRRAGAHGRACSSTTAAGSPATAPSSTTSSGGSRTRAGHAAPLREAPHRGGRREGQGRRVDRHLQRERRGARRAGPRPDRSSCASGQGEAARRRRRGALPGELPQGGDARRSPTTGCGWSRPPRSTRPTEPGGDGSRRGPISRAWNVARPSGQ